MSFSPRKSLLIISIALLLSVGFVLGGQAAEKRARNSEWMESLELFGKVYEKITNHYVDEIDPNELIDSAIDGMLSKLDPHSQLLTDEVYDDLMISTTGEFGGLGITIAVRDDYPTVVSPIEGTPAFRMGIQGGDQIVEIEGESTKGWKSQDAVAKLRGPKGSEVTIGIRRVGEERVLPFTIVRDIIHVESVPYAFMLKDGVGYVRIANFARTTADELKEKITALQGQGMQSLILDLRWNPGGLLQAAKEVSELFLDKGQLIVYTKGRLSQQNMSYYASGEDKARWPTLPLLVLVNGSSASASEILAGAIQDHDVGVILGTTSYGKGSVQTVFELAPNKALKLTTAKYYTPSGRSIHKDRTRKEEETVENPDESSAKPKTPNPEQPSPEVFHTDMGREVYGGGGITPDVDVKPNLLNDFDVALERDQTFFVYATEFAAKNPNVTTDLQVSSKLVDDFYALASGRPKLGEFLKEVDLKLSRELYDQNGDYVKEGIRREIMRRVFGPTQAYRVSIDKDNQIWEAVDLISRAKTREGLLKLAEAERQKQLAKAADATAAAPMAPAVKGAPTVKKD